MQTQDEPFLRIRNVVKEFDGVRAVDDLSIDIHRKELFCAAGWIFQIGRAHV